MYMYHKRHVLVVMTVLVSGTLHVIEVVKKKQQPAGHAINTYPMLVDQLVNQLLISLGMFIFYFLDDQLDIQQGSQSGFTDVYVSRNSSSMTSLKAFLAYFTFKSVGLERFF